MDWAICLLLLFRAVTSEPPISCQEKNCLESNTTCYDENNMPQRCIPAFHNMAHEKRPEVTNICSDVIFCRQTRNPSVFFPRRCQRCERAQHLPEFMTDFNQPDSQTWWQSDTMFEGIQSPNSVNITFKFGKAYVITYVAVLFPNSRPESYAIYKKKQPTDEWTPWQFFSGSCRSTYKIPDRAPVLPGKEAVAICTSEFSDIVPTSHNRVIFQTLDGRPSGGNFEESEELQEWITASEVMISLTRLNTFGDEIFSDPDVKRSYYYAISDIAIGGRCQCHGHARECVASTGPGINKKVCKCEHNTAGVDCEKCAPLFQDRQWKAATASDANECLACECNGLARSCFFDPKLYNETKHGGHCVDCQGHTTGPHCELCMKGHYRIPGRKDCFPCNCDENGSTDSECDMTGRCNCKHGVSGVKCDRCSAGYDGLTQSGCKDCQCALAGSLHNTLRCHEGQCTCKLNVEGQRCDRCKPGFFNLDINNTFGCSPCFCHGRSSDCASAIGFFQIIYSVKVNNLTEEMPLEVQHDNATRDFDSAPVEIVEYQNGHDPVYFEVPKQILQQIKHYPGQAISFKLWKKSEYVSLSQRDIIIEGNGYSFSAPLTEQGNPSPRTFGQQYHYQLDAVHWNPRVSDVLFYSTLKNVTSFKIRMTYAPGDRSYLSDFKLITASSINGPPFVPVTAVEQCRCPPEYQGQFCEVCADGYAREQGTTNGISLTRCIKCQCNGHSDVCDAETGKCFCQHNTSGEDCSQCARGFHGDPTTGAANACQPCECPGGGSCLVVDGEVFCTECRDGYTGQKCDYCSEDYFNDPCEKCECNGNIDPNYIRQCDSFGKCLNCYYNTTGFDCERCAPGYWGDPLTEIKGDCRLCNCYARGTRRPTASYTDLECRQSDGQCDCQVNVIGKQCDQCQNGYFNLSSGNGCEACTCNLIGSIDQNCDVITGSCQCKQGVVGRRCDHCAINHYAFGQEGCKPCDCDQLGSESRECDVNTGQCLCKNNVEGRRCDQCSENKYDLRSGCPSCDDCYTLIQKRKNTLNESMTSLNNHLLDIKQNTTNISDAEYDQSLSNTRNMLIELQFSVEQYNQRSLAPKISKIEEIVRITQKTVHQIKLSEEDIAHVHQTIEKFTLEKLEVTQLLLGLSNTVNQLENELESRRKKNNISKNSPLQHIAREAIKLNQHMEKKKDGIFHFIQTNVNNQIQMFNESIEIVFGDDVSLEIRELKKKLEEVDNSVKDLSQTSKQTHNEADKILNESVFVLQKVESFVIPEIELSNNIVWDDNQYDEDIKVMHDTLKVANNEIRSVNTVFSKVKNQSKRIKNTYKLLQHERSSAIKTQDSAMQMKHSLDTILKILEDTEHATHKNDYIRDIQKADDIEKELDILGPEITKQETQLTQVVFNVKKVQTLQKKIGHEVEGLVENSAVLKENQENFNALLEKETKSLEDFESVLKDVQHSFNEQTKRAAKSMATSQKKLRQALKTRNHVVRVSNSVEKALKQLDVARGILSSSFENADEASLDELESLLDKLDRKMQEINLENVIKAEQNEILKKGRFELKLDVDWLSNELLNLQAILKSLPSKCFNHVKIEQQ